jgi:hypothetical protein
MLLAAISQQRLFEAERINLTASSSASRARRRLQHLTEVEVRINISRRLGL